MSLGLIICQVTGQSAYELVCSFFKKKGKPDFFQKNFQQSSLPSNIPNLTKVLQWLESGTNLERSFN